MNDDVAPEAPAGVDTEKPAAARVYDWYLGGSLNWAVDREFGKRIEHMWPYVRPGAKHNREFLGRAVRSAVRAGVRQFIDLGSGVPTAGNVHEVVVDELPEGDEANVVYVDYEPVAIAHATLILERQEVSDWAGAIQADLRSPKTVLEHPRVHELIDFEEPVCLLMVAVLHFAGPDDHPRELVRTYQDRLAPGSQLVLSHMSVGDSEGEDADGVRWFAEQYRDTSNPVWLRDKPEIEELFGDWPLLEPGVVHLPDWRPERTLGPAETRARPFAWCGVARKPRA